ncbi:DUF1444 family protein [Myxococcus sp. CA033]|uniref:DUF1444 family protein n=1 Tax=Myxococcus sp. CA033 TaxID=2741516 RepID=UPI00157A9A26|nr:DUF1444 family protein [Myxococcus sp. CA033]NTX40869.1 DUF1444 family protein [Myxococcus sp. CA033]
MGFWKKLFGLAKAGSESSASPPETVSPREYLWREMEAALKAVPTVTEVTRLPDDYGLRFLKNGEAVQMYLDNLFAETREVSPDERAQQIGRFLSAFAGESRDKLSWKEARKRLLPVVRSATFGLMAPPGESRPRPMVERRTIPFLRELLVLDLPDATMYVQHDHLKEWGVSEAKAFKSAFANLDRIHASGVELQEENPSPMWSVDSNDTYEASRLLHPGFLASFTPRVNGRPIAIIPTRSTLVIAGDGDPALLKRLCTLAEREHEASTRGISPALYTVDDAGHVVPYRLAGNDEFAQLVRRGHLRLAMGEYATQKQLLEAQHAAEDVDVFVASFGVLVREQDNRPISWSSWSKDVDTLLPVTDVVAIQAGEEDFFMVAYPDVTRIASRYLSFMPELWPPRYRTIAWPSNAVLNELRAAQVDLAAYTGD